MPVEPPTHHAPAGAQPMLPLDEPVPFELTARARRLVAPTELPALRLVRSTGSGPHDADVDRDPARARARALARSGADVDAIATELDADPLLVAGWTADLVPTRLRAVGPQRAGASAPPPDADDDRWEAVAAARREAAGLLASSPQLPGAVGLLAAVLRPDRHALVLVGDDPAVVTAAWALARTRLGADPAAARVLLRVSPSTAGDRSAHRLAADLGIPVERVVTSRHPAVPPDAVDVRLRVADPDLAARAAGWRAALLDLVAAGAS